MIKFKGRVRQASLLAGLPVLVLAGCGSPEENAQKYYQSGMDLVAKHDDVAARMEFLKALKYKYDRIGVGRALVGGDERTKAGTGPVFNDLRRVVELDPNDLDSRVKLGHILVNG